jgi:hypothetical protein
MLVPRMLVSAVPASGSTSSISSVTAYTSTTMSCIDEWKVTVDWVIANPDNSLYSLELLLEQPSTTTLLTNQTCASGTYVYSTGVSADPWDGSGAPPITSTSVQFRLRLVRRSDSAVIESSDSNVVTVYWTAC